jgi:hypothetical protein
MPLPIHSILWAGNNASHHDHLHVEGIPYYEGKTTGEGDQPPYYNPGQTDAVEAIYGAMEQGYGTGYYFQDTKPPEPAWSHMGWYNRRPIAGSTTWSQHAWANALDIGPLYGVEEQEPIYEYLINYEEDDMPTAEEVAAATVAKLMAEPIWSTNDGQGNQLNYETVISRDYRNTDELTVAHRKVKLGADMSEVLKRLEAIEKKLDEL